MMNHMKKKHHCSNCNSVIKYLSIYNRFTECNKCQTNRINSEQIEYDTNIIPNINDIYHQYKITDEPVFLRKRKIQSDQIFEMLYKYLSNNIDPAIWNDCMFGIYKSDDYPFILKGTAIMLTTKQAIRLINLYLSNSKEKCDKWQFSHAIGPHIL